MNREKIDLFKEKIRENKKILYILVITLWVLFTVFVIYIVRLPLAIIKENNKNNITQETIFNYKADVIPFALNPAGELIDVERGTFTKVTKYIILHISSSIRSDKPVKISGTKKVVLKLIAEELWEKEYLLSQESNFQMEGSDNKVIDGDYSIDLEGLTKFIKVVEQEIGTSGKYTFEIKPVIKGTITYDGKEIPIDLSAQAAVDYSQTQIKVKEEKKFSKVTPIVDTVITPQKFIMFGKEFSLVKAKCLFASIYLIIFIILVASSINSAKSKKSKESEVQKIDKKYRVRLIHVMQEVTKPDHEKIILNSFAGLLTISDEKESPILRYENQDKVLYYVMNEGYVFLYEVYNNLDEKLSPPKDPIIVGKCYANER